LQVTGSGRTIAPMDTLSAPDPVVDRLLAALDRQLRIITLRFGVMLAIAVAILAAIIKL
jgi:hypothetical protein